MLRSVGHQCRQPWLVARRSLHDFKLSAEVHAALHENKPIVALESTIISHGMPFPQNYDMAVKVESLVRQNGAVPATIAILNGKICVGLGQEDLHTLASLGAKATKCSTRDIAAVVAAKGTGATTVSSTMRIAHAAGIQVFVTGGIGGVHRYCEETLDISTDLMELARTPVAVVCAGVKSILDIPKTLEFLETNAVPVVGYKTNDFPAFFTTTSGSKAHVRLNSPKECAQLIATSKGLSLPNGFVIAVPNPSPADSAIITQAIESGLEQAKENNIAGNAVTPFLLKRINELTGGKSLTSNIALVEHNAVIGSKIACALKDLKKVAPSSPSDVVVMGGTVLDIISRPNEQFVHGTSNIGNTKQTWGGVGRNIAECLHRLQVPTLLISNVGKDATGQSLIQQLQAIGMQTCGISMQDNHTTATYCAMLNADGNLEVAVADMAIAETMDSADLNEWTSKATKMLVFDGNLSAKTMTKLTTAAKNVPLIFFEPTSLEKACRVVHSNALQNVHVISPNQDELAGMARALIEDEGHAQWSTVDAGVQVLKGQKHLPLIDGILSDLLTVAKCMHVNEKKVVHILVTMGKEGVVVATTEPLSELPQDAVAYGTSTTPPLSIVYLPGTPKNVWNCTGAGDSFVGGTIYGILKGHDIVQNCCTKKLGFGSTNSSRIESKRFGLKIFTSELMFRAPFQFSHFRPWTSRGMSSISYHVVGWKACPYYERAASVATSMQHLFPGKVHATIHEHANKQSFVDWLAATDFASQFPNDSRPLNHFSSPFCYLEDANGAKFVGGCDDTLAYFRARTQSTTPPVKPSILHANDVDDGKQYDWDLIVIGGGSGGLAASKEAAKYGKKVLVLDYVKPSPQGSSWGLGGTCVNVGCIPKKLMHQSSVIGELLHKDAEAFGWNVSNATFDWSKLVASVQDHIHGLNFKYRVDLRDKKVKYENFLGTFKGAHTLTLTNEAKGKPPKDVTFRRAIIAVGGRPKQLDCPGGELAITSDDIFSREQAPGKTLVVGASYVALECAGFLKGQGFDVTVMVRSILLRGFDTDMAARIGTYMEEESGIAFIKGSVPTSIEQLPNGQLKVTHSHGEDVYDTVLNATGRYPDVKGLNLQSAGVALNPKSGRIQVSNEQTSVPHIYAIGDVIDAPELTPVAIQAGRLLAKRLYADSTATMNYQKVCTAVFTPVEYGCCGLSEDDAIESIGAENISVYHQNFTPLEWSLSADRAMSNECYCKLIVDRTQQDRVVGFHYLGPNAGEVTQAVGVAMRLNATYEDFVNTVGIHPTTAEIFTTLEITKESGLDASAAGC
ncbi:thioredoxin reductase 1 [Thraustotheca clavata]|uniref:Thioredoxin reductase n=1 Tax=Thraustotheca clavata TaxID=74557 RepID=A0A1V9Z9H3_9STRA|nr:thioredoxin reductase 1 [Thraustotheca clavata]